MERESKQVPLVIYKGGVRTELGKVIVGADGSFLGQVAKEHWPLVKDLFKPSIGELSIAPAQPHQMTIDYSKFRE